MTTAISALSNTTQHRHSLANDTKARTETVPSAEKMAETTVAILAKAITERMVIGDPGTGKPRAEMPVEIRPPSITISDAANMMASILHKLPVMLGALMGAQDPIQHEAGAEQRASEGAVSGVQLKAIDAQALPVQSEPATGMDAEAVSRSANFELRLASSPAHYLLTLLREVLLKFEAMERKNGAAMVTMQREATIAAGDRGVEKAKENLTGAIASGAVMGAVGLYATKKTYESTDMVKKSHVKNMNEGNASNVAVHDSRAALKSTTTPTAHNRPARDADGVPVLGGTESSRPDAMLQADLEADLKPMGRGVLDQTSAPHNEALQSQHAAAVAHAQIPASHAMLLNMIAPSVGGTVTAGVQIEAEMTEAERQLLLNVADTLKRVADGHQDQQMKTREMREATTQLVESLQNLAASTSSHIIGNA